MSAKRGAWLKAAISLKGGPALVALSWSEDITYHWWAHASLHHDTWLLFPNHMSYCWVSSNHTELWVDMPETSWHREDADISVVIIFLSVLYCWMCLSTSKYLSNNSNKSKLIDDFLWRAQLNIKTMFVFCFASSWLGMWSVLSSCLRVSENSSSLHSSKTCTLG